MNLTEITGYFHNKHFNKWSYVREEWVWLETALLYYAIIRLTQKKSLAPFNKIQWLVNWTKYVNNKYKCNPIYLT